MFSYGTVWNHSTASRQEKLRPQTLLFPQIKLPVFVMRSGNQKTLKDWLDFSGHSPRMTCWMAQRAYWKPELSWRSIVEDFAKFTRYSRVMNSILHRTRCCRICGTSLITAKPRSSEAENLELWTSTESDGSTLFLAPSGMARRQCTVLKRNRGSYWSNATNKIATQPHKKNAWSPNRLDWLWSKWVIGSRIVDNAIEFPRTKGKITREYYGNFLCVRKETRIFICCLPLLPLSIVVGWKSLLFFVILYSLWSWCSFHF